MKVSRAPGLTGRMVFQPKNKACCICALIVFNTLSCSSNCGFGDGYPESDKSSSTHTAPEQVERAFPETEKTGLKGLSDAGPVSSHVRDEPPIPPALTDSHNILLLGFEGDTPARARTDAMLILCLKYRRAEAGVVSIPRDLWVKIPGHRPDRINSVYAKGENDPATGTGIRLIKKVIKNELGVRIPYVVAVDYAGFERIVDILGGIPVRVVCPIRDRFIDEDADGGYRDFSVSAGLNHMSGARALLFARSRHGRGDWDRARRQQAVLMGLRTRALSLDTVSSLPRIWEELKNSIKTDMSFKTGVKIVHLMTRIKTWQIHGLVIKEPCVTPWKTPDGRDVLLPERSRISEALENLFSSPLPGSRMNMPCPPENAGLINRKAAKQKTGP